MNNKQKLLVATAALTGTAAMAAAPGAYDTGELAAWIAWAVAGIIAIGTVLMNLPIAKRLFKSLMSFIGR